MRIPGSFMAQALVHQSMSTSDHICWTVHLCIHIHIFSPQGLNCCYCFLNGCRYVVLLIWQTFILFEVLKKTKRKEMKLIKTLAKYWMKTL